MPGEGSLKLESVSLTTLLHFFLTPGIFHTIALADHQDFSMSAQAIPTDADYVQLSALLGVWEGDLVLRCSARDRTHQAVSDTEYLLKVNRKRITIVTSAFEELLSATTQNWAESSETRSITPRQVPELELDEDWLVIWFLVGSIYQIPEYAYLLYPGREWHILFELYQAAYKYAMAGARYSITTSLT